MDQWEKRVKNLLEGKHLHHRKMEEKASYCSRLLACPFPAERYIQVSWHLVRWQSCPRPHLQPRFTCFHSEPYTAAQRDWLHLCRTIQGKRKKSRIFCGGSQDSAQITSHSDLPTKQEQKSLPMNRTSHGQHTTSHKTDEVHLPKCILRWRNHNPWYEEPTDQGKVSLTSYYHIKTQSLWGQWLEDDLLRKVDWRAWNLSPVCTNTRGQCGQAYHCVINILWSFKINWWSFFQGIRKVKNFTAIHTFNRNVPLFWHRRNKSIRQASWRIIVSPQRQHYENHTRSMYTLENGKWPWKVLPWCINAVSSVALSLHREPR